MSSGKTQGKSSRQTGFTLFLKEFYENNKENANPNPTSTDGGNDSDEHWFQRRMLFLINMTLEICLFCECLSAMFDVHNV